MQILGGPLVVARRCQVVRPAAELAGRVLPPICAVTGLHAQETLPARVVDRRTPLWLLLFGIVPYVVVRVLLGSGDTGLRVEVPVGHAAADRLALLRSAQLVGFALSFLLLLSIGALGGGVLALVAAVPFAVAVTAAMLESSIAVRPILREGLLVMSVSHQLAAALSTAPVVAAPAA